MMNYSLFLVLICLFVLFDCFHSYSFPLIDELKRTFHHRFENKCSKYPFVHSFINKLENPGDRYLMFVYQEKGLKNGGLGDRIGGLISAIAMANRFNRTLIIRDSTSLSEYFRPYHPHDIHSPKPKYSWANNDWTHYDLSLANNDATEYDLWFCINNAGDKISKCSMETGDVSQPIVLYRSNRCYLCHYDRLLDSYPDLKESLGLQHSTDLYEVAGCLLRLVFWPTEALWQRIDNIYHEMSLSQNISYSDLFNSHQLAIHFRCGDKSFLHGGCMVSSGDSHALSYGTPQQMVQCANELLNDSSTSSVTFVKPLVFISSDNIETAKQMTSLLDYTHILLAPKGCHLELDASAACNLETLALWFIMAQSRMIITQTNEDQHRAPSSSFSRYAGIYSLHERSFRDGKHCNETFNPHFIGKIQHSNWFC